MAQDIVKGRPTEIDYMNGHVVAQGKLVGVAIPVSIATVAMTGAMELEGMLTGSSCRSLND